MSGMDQDRLYVDALNAAIVDRYQEMERTRAWLARAAGVDEQTMRRYLRGEREMPVSVLSAVARALEMTVPELAEVAEASLRIGDLTADRAEILEHLADVARQPVARVTKRTRPRKDGSRGNHGAL